jgi:hypothetical protein
MEAGNWILNSMGMERENNLITDTGLEGEQEGGMEDGGMEDGGKEEG